MALRLYQHKIIEPLGEARSDFEVFRDLAGQLSFKDEFTQGRETEEDSLRFLFDTAELPMSYDAFKEQAREVPDHRSAANDFAAFRAYPA